MIVELRMSFRLENMIGIGFPVRNALARMVIGYERDVEDEHGISWDVGFLLFSVCQLLRDIYLPMVADVHVLQSGAKTVYT